MFEEIKDIKSTRKELREFGLTIGVILVILGAVTLWRGKPTYPYFLGVGALFITLGLMLPGVLKPLQKVWMSFAVIMGFFVSRIILTILFYVVVTPTGVIVRILGKDILDQRIDKNRKTYWQERDAKTKDKVNYENQY
ncbi:MAG: ECF transporter S component [Candidatus Omnitrophica bacterium]|nr:ECF transporter S component [Candidatus Omnitrophota bacterium]